MIKMRRKDHRDNVYREAGRMVRENIPRSCGDLVKPPWRGNWISLKKPWHWIFTFWKNEWVNYGTFEEAEFGTPEYELATHEITNVFRR